MWSKDRELQAPVRQVKGATRTSADITTLQSAHGTTLAKCIKGGATEHFDQSLSRFRTRRLSRTLFHTPIQGRLSFVICVLLFVLLFVCNVYYQCKHLFNFKVKNF